MAELLLSSLPSLLLALDHAYVRRDAALHEGFELALMPPVQGG